MSIEPDWNYYLDQTDDPAALERVMKIYEDFASGDMSPNRANDLLDDAIKQRSDEEFWTDDPTAINQEDINTEVIFSTIGYDPELAGEQWTDVNGNVHFIIDGEPEEEGAERRQVFMDIEEALLYVDEIGAGESYFDIYASEGGYAVYYVG